MELVWIALSIVDGLLFFLRAKSGTNENDVQLIALIEHLALTFQ